MAARVGAFDSGGVITIEMSGWVPPEWNRRFYKAGWRWMRGSYIKSYYKDGQSIAPQVTKEAQELAEAYNNRFKEQAA